MIVGRALHEGHCSRTKEQFWDEVTRAHRPDAVDLSALCLPHEVGEQLFQAACELDRDLGDALVAVFRHTRLTRVRLRDCSVTDRGNLFVVI